MGTARIAMIGVLAIAIVANMVQFLGIDEIAPDNYEAISRKPSSDIVEIAERNGAVNRAYGLYWMISEQQPDADVQVSADDSDAFVVLRFLVLGFAKADSASLGSHVLADATNLDDLLAHPGIASIETGLSDGHSHRGENWYYIRGECSDDDSPSLVLGHLPEESTQALVVVDSCLLADSGFNE
ncbi:hypothetical protein A20C1_11471 [marine actinobacterium PHSC20C1]|nr:hypothetical protein A20C1_11471 [marine actinobacterium PHSC20C1]